MQVQFLVPLLIRLMSPGQVNQEFSMQPGIKDAFDKVKLWDINRDNAKRIHVAIGKMIAVDLEPYHVVEKPGFIELVNTLEKKIQHALT